jgi:hypothetical protein
VFDGSADSRSPDSGVWWRVLGADYFYGVLLCGEYGGDDGGEGYGGGWGLKVVF